MAHPPPNHLSENNVIWTQLLLWQPNYLCVLKHFLKIRGKLFFDVMVTFSIPQIDSEGTILEVWAQITYKDGDKWQQFKW